MTAGDKRLILRLEAKVKEQAERITELEGADELLFVARDKIAELERERDAAEAKGRRKAYREAVALVDRRIRWQTARNTPSSDYTVCVLAGVRASFELREQEATDGR